MLQNEKTVLDASVAQLYPAQFGFHSLRCCSILSSNLTFPLPLPAASALLPQTYPFSLEWLPPAAYLVGGNVRDALLGRQADYLDLDFVLPSGAVAVARAIANHYHAGFVLLDAERQIARVVFDRATVDFAQQVGPTLEEDLHRRDFTVNAIAYSPHTDEVIDPLQGYADLKQHLIRMIAPENLKEDPLRLLRAYRQAAQLDFVLEPDTARAIQQLAPLLNDIAPERVQAELNYLLSTAQGTPLLIRAWQDGLLSGWLPHATLEGLLQIAKIDDATRQLEHRWPEFGLVLSGWLKDQHKRSGTGRSWLKIAKLANLTSSRGTEAEPDLWRLKYSRAEVQSVLTVLRCLPHLCAVTQSDTDRKTQYHFFLMAGATFPALAVLAIAQGVSLEAIAPLMDRFLTPNDPIAHPQPLLTGRDLMMELGLRAGPQIGQLLERLQLAQAEGVVTTPEEALAFAQAIRQEQAL